MGFMEAAKTDRPLLVFINLERPWLQSFPHGEDEILLRNHFTNSFLEENVSIPFL